MSTNYSIAFEQPQSNLNDQIPIQSNSQQINNLLPNGSLNQQQFNSRIQQQQQNILSQQIHQQAYPQQHSLNMAQSNKNINSGSHQQQHQHQQTRSVQSSNQTDQPHQQYQHQSNTSQNINNQDLNNTVKKELQQQQQQQTTSSSSSSIKNFNLIPPYNPFDLNSYPMTNPPIFDSTFMLPYTTAEGIPRRRRISISNGQIGQIMNHEAFFDDNNDELVNNNSLDDELTQKFNDYELNRPQTSFIVENQNQHSQQQQQQQLPPAQQQQHQPPAQHIQHQNDHHIQQQHQQQMTQPVPHPHQHQIHQQKPQQQHQVPPHHHQLQQSQQQQHQQQIPIPQKPASPPVAGVPPPNHQLIYNNEVIYNPDNGPIAGTAAWKKERLLERNRIAASKCRQRKKNAQLQLQDNLNKMENDLKFKNDYIKNLQNQLSYLKNGINQFLNLKDEEILKNLIRNFDNNNINNNNDNNA
ncbi:uncharacterized protein KGF55_000623 [Candida pseudojiufengensis]|uniref:uncharacterized protein n=1 Tax=Candida pseudojiufengensis TaxID=497109 RepID=UPI0022246354|nr:uncharacterized protein KGF55_000623 [Candida pseudojiufengensis]KAI5966314.1 hypothetical protein KGF55_000623 [Candida pseudojiufengensis]